MTAIQSDLTAYARIRDAALDGFARRGVAATSIRDVAREAGVSPGTVQHHFATKDDLRAAVDDHVIATAVAAFVDFPELPTADDVQRELGDRLTAVVRDHHTALLYVARSAGDGDAAALRILDGFIAIAEQQWQAIANDGRLRPDLDLMWTALQPVVIALGSVVLHAALDRHLDAPFLSADGLRRWNAANSALFRHGVYREEPKRGRPEVTGGAAGADA